MLNQGEHEGAKREKVKIIAQMVQFLDGVKKQGQPEAHREAERKYLSKQGGLHGKAHAEADHA